MSCTGPLVFRMLETLLSFATGVGRRKFTKLAGVEKPDGSATAVSVNVPATPKSVLAAASFDCTSVIGSSTLPSVPHPSDASKRPPDTTLSTLNIEDLRIACLYLFQTTVLLTPTLHLCSMKFSL